MIKDNVLVSKNGQVPLTGVIYILFLLLFLIIAVYVYKLPPYLPLLLIVSLGVFLVALLQPDFALVILILSMLLSPEFYMGAITGRTVTFRFDDALIFVIFFGWLARVAIHKEINLLRPTPLNTPIILYITVSIVASLMGALEGNVRLQQSFFYITKYVEYYVLFFMVANNLRSVKQAKVFTVVLLVTCLIVCVYAMMHVNSMARISAPFEGKEGEANTLAGYLLLMLSITLGLFLYEASLKWQLVFLGITALIIPTFLFTLSRGSWIAFFPMAFTLVALTKRGKGMILLSLLSIFMLLPLLSPQRARDRVVQTMISNLSTTKEYTFMGKKYTLNQDMINRIRLRVAQTFEKNVPGSKEYGLMGRKFTLDQSAVSRVESWTYAFNKWLKRPFLGYGVPAGSVVDNQYARVIREVGIIGFSIYIWMMVRIFRTGRQSFILTKGNNFAQGLSLGFLAGFVGLLFQSFSAETFILIRIMEPFWFLAALVMILPELTMLPQQEKIA